MAIKLPPCFAALDDMQARTVAAYVSEFFARSNDANAWLRQVTPAVAYLQAAERMKLDLPNSLRSLETKSLCDQTRVLDVRHYDVGIPIRPRRPGLEELPNVKELAVAGMISDQGLGRAYFDEGRSILGLVQITCGFEMARILCDLCLDPLGYQWSFAFFRMIRARFLNVHDGHPDFRALTDIQSRLHEAAHFSALTEDAIRTRAAQLFRSERERVYFNTLAPAMAAASGVLGTGLLAKLVARYLEAGSWLGWPDLTILQGYRISFVEVKDKDKLTETQIRWFQLVAKPLNLDVAVVRIDNSRGSSGLR